jgi:hypothetical protein
MSLPTKIKNKICLVISLLSINSLSYASETYAYCVTKNGEWKFLTNGVVHGEWIRKYHQVSVDWFYGTEFLYTFYFKPDVSSQ